MSKSSVVTSREAPVADVTSTAGTMVVHARTVTVETHDRVELFDLTPQVMDIVAGHRLGEGIVSVWSLHTTCALFINESQRALHADICRFLEQTVARETDWMHNNPDQSDCDRMNADAHLRAMLLGHSVTLQVSGGEVVLGRWQRILMAELDGPRARSIRIQVMGIV